MRAASGAVERCCIACFIASQHTAFLRISYVLSVQTAEGGRWLLCYCCNLFVTFRCPRNVLMKMACPALRPTSHHVAGFMAEPGCLRCTGIAALAGVRCSFVGSYVVGYRLTPGCSMREPMLDASVRRMQAAAVLLSCYAIHPRVLASMQSSCRVRQACRLSGRP